jgi:hypothetical protein
MITRGLHNQTMLSHGLGRLGLLVFFLRTEFIRLKSGITRIVNLKSGV